LDSFAQNSDLWQVLVGTETTLPVQNKAGELLDQLCDCPFSRRFLLHELLVHNNSETQSLVETDMQ
jgi:hypothetical protein